MHLNFCSNSHCTRQDGVFGGMFATSVSLPRMGTFLTCVESRPKELHVVEMDRLGVE